MWTRNPQIRIFKGKKLFGFSDHPNSSSAKIQGGRVGSAAEGTGHVGYVQCRAQVGLGSGTAIQTSLMKLERCIARATLTTTDGTTVRWNRTAPDQEYLWRRKYGCCNWTNYCFLYCQDKWWNRRHIVGGIIVLVVILLWFLEFLKYLHKKISQNVQ